MESSFGKAQLLQLLDPILKIQFHHLMLVAGMLEIFVAGVCLLSKSKTTVILLVACLAGSLLTYRLGLWWIGWHRACACLGNLTDAIHISPQRADDAMKGVLAYLFFGSYVFLFHQWWKRKAEGRMQSNEIKPETKVGG